MTAALRLTRVVLLLAAALAAFTRPAPVASTPADDEAAVVHVLNRVTFGLPPAHGAVYPRGRSGESMRQIAQVIRADVGLEIAFADMEGRDTHVAQGGEQGQLANRLQEFGAALAAFAQDLGDAMSAWSSSPCPSSAAPSSKTATAAPTTATAPPCSPPAATKGGNVYGRWPGRPHLALPATTLLFPGWTPPPTRLGVMG